MSILPYLETFSAVIEHGSFTAAAQALGISKPVVSKQVSALEQHLGVQLLQRTTRRLHLTQAGEMFASYSKRIMTEAYEAEQSVLPLQSEPQGRLRISAPESMAISLLSDVLPMFQRKYPKLELDISITGRFVDLVEEGIDLAIRVGTLEDSSLIARKLMPCRFHLCASTAYLDVHGRPIHPGDLVKHNCLIYSQGQHPNNWLFLDSEGKEFHVKVSGNLFSDTGHLLMNAALNNLGVFMAPTYMVKQALAEGQLESILDEFTPSGVGLYAVYPHTKLVSKKVRAFVDFLADTLHQ
ncbi:LysR family transcriptional regulator [Ferrimonas sp. YFM]|uniref:LysR family transcriptional regulator n=1 Tax=Ferrimonas sp. YFM TaxID=3028878 RepID=UPI0025729CEB|nr:LysR family transcriptional regulator [Ferrimonas sp. YFM]BDY05482.1 transcriptional regulator [Ferrimonas sp. YFM]